MTNAPLAPCPLELIPARRLGSSSRSVRNGEVVAVTRGVYVAAPAWRDLQPWTRYLVRVHAAASQHPEAVFCLESAAVLRGEPIFGDPAVVHVLGGADGTSRVSGGVLVHTTRDARAIEEDAGVRMVGRVDTAVDLARSRHNAVGLTAADAALRADPSLTVEQLVATNEARASSRGRRHARWPLHRASALPESALESVDRAVIEWLGFPEPELQVWIRGDGRTDGDRDDRVDKWWPAFAVAGEGDGDLKYDGRYGDARDALERRHSRDARLFRRGVRAVPHWGWAEAIGAYPLRAILRSAGLPIIAPEDTTQLFSLRRALRTAAGG
jgi:hypothetical protein